MSSQPETTEFQRGLEAAAAIADLYETENFRLASDTILTDPVLKHDLSPEAFIISEGLQLEGHMHASMAHAARNIAVAIRETATEIPTTDLREARRQGLLDAADVLRGWIHSFGDYVPLPALIPANIWATDSMNDCIDQIEKMAAEVQNVPT